jgi:hypothetical protein
MSAPDHCPLCLDVGIVATVNGPTCIHRPPGEWFPSWWGDDPLSPKGDARRAAWLKDMHEIKTGYPELTLD